jgi:hypothetical protein
LVRELLIEEQDFALLPFSRHGGWNKANNIFEGQLPALLQEINVRVLTA